MASFPSANGYLPDLCQPKAVLFVILVTQLLALVLAVAKFGLLSFDWAGFSVLSLYMQWVVLSSCALLCPMRGYLNKLSVSLSTSLCLLLVVFVSALFYWLGLALKAYLFPSDNVVFDRFNLLAVLLVTVVLSGIALRYLYLSHLLRQRNQAELQARIQALQARIKPHFLFNSMNTIASLISLDAEKAERAVEDLSGLLRVSLKDDVLISWEEEIDISKQYLAIEKLRLGERLSVKWLIDEALLTKKVPCLTLQPLLENAIYHGIENIVDGGEIIVRLYTDQQDVVLRLCNPVAVASHSQRGHLGMAQQNIRHRLQALFGDKTLLRVNSDASSYELILRYPLSEA